jgi:DNA repair exonuclease SbcCD nuclease subunit
MKIVAAGDLHIRERRPENRIDSDYILTQFDKIEWILNYTKEHEAILLLPGDVFDSPTQTNLILQMCIRLLFKYSYVSVAATYGQHDLRYHNSTNYDNTALAVLTAARVLYDLETPQWFDDTKVVIYGCPFGEKIPEITTKGFNVLLIHKMIIDSDKIWEGQEEYEYAQNLLRKHKFDLIISGDNHKFFHSEVGDKHLFNCGSLMRMTTAQLDHIPRIVLFDTDTREYEIVDVPIRPISEVFDLSKIEEKKHKEEQFTAFVKGLSESKDISLNFQDRLFAYIKENMISDEIKDLIMEAANGKNN